MKLHLIKTGNQYQIEGTYDVLCLSGLLKVFPRLPRRKRLTFHIRKTRAVAYNRVEFGYGDVYPYWLSPSGQSGHFAGNFVEKLLTETFKKPSHLYIKVTGSGAKVEFEG
jgi:hypothetical protein